MTPTKETTVVITPDYIEVTGWQMRAGASTAETREEISKSYIWALERLTEEAERLYDEYREEPVSKRVMITPWFNPLAHLGNTN